MAPAKPTKAKKQKSASASARPKATAPIAARELPFAAYLARVGALAAKYGGSLALRPPAKAKELRELEALPGVVVPKELGAAWRTSDGCGENLFTRPDFLTGYEFLRVSEARKERAGFAKRAPRYADYEEESPRDRRILPGWYQPGWLPFASFGGASLVLLVDASPAPPGRSGQIIAFTHDPDEITYVAGSFSAYLAASLAWFEKKPEELLGLD